MINPELKSQISTYITKCDEAHLEYEEKHGDAGDAYCHCAMEDKRKWGQKFHDYVAEQFPELTEDQIDEMLSDVDEWSFDMVPGHRFSGETPAEEGLTIWGACIEEVENQHEVKAIADEFDCEVDEVREIVAALYETSDHCIGSIPRKDFDTFYTYQCTDACWFAVIPRSWFVDKIEEMQDAE